MDPKKIIELNDLFLRHIHRHRRYLKWREASIFKQPGDIILYEQEIWRSRPDYIIDVGTARGGSAVFYGDMLEMTGKGKVISIDIKKRRFPQHPRVTYLTGSSTDIKIINQVKELVGNSSAMVVLDSDHSRVHVKRELCYYSKIVTSGQALVVEDCYVDPGGALAGPGEARDWFLRRTRLFKREAPENQVLVAVTRGGWLRKI